MSDEWRLIPLGHVEGPFAKPATVEIANENEIYVVDDSDTSSSATWSGGRRIWRVTDSGAAEIRIADPGFDPDDIALGQAGSIYAYHSGSGDNVVRMSANGEVRQTFSLGEGLSRIAVDRLGRLWAGYVDPADGRWLKLYEANGRLLWSNEDRRSHDFHQMFAAVGSVFDIAMAEDGSIFLALGSRDHGPILAHLGRDHRPVSPPVMQSEEEEVEPDCITVGEKIAIATPAVAGMPWIIWDGAGTEVGFADLEVDGHTNPYVSAVSAHGPLICACVPQLQKLLILRIERIPGES